MRVKKRKYAGSYIFNDIHINELALDEMIVVDLKPRLKFEL